MISQCGVRTRYGACVLPLGHYVNARTPHVAPEKRAHREWDGPDFTSNSEYITCDLPTKGQRVWFSIPKREKGLWFGPQGIEGTGTVLVHWHYDGCAFTVRLDTGDEVHFMTGYRDVEIDELVPA